MIWCLFIVCCVRIVFANGAEHFTLSDANVHEFCLSYMEWRKLPDIYRGLICGSSQIDTKTKQLFLQTGLYHLLVVSGSHLVLLDSYLEKTFSKNFKIKWLALLLYCEMCLLQAPILRALCSYSVVSLTHSWRLGLRTDQRVLAAGLMTLIVDPTLILSLSLQLSWMAALCISLPLSLRLKTFLFLLYLLPLLGPQHPWTAVNNLVFATVFETLLFPFSIVSVITPFSAEVAHFVWSTTLTLLHYLPHSPHSGELLPYSLAPWLALFTTHLFHFWIRK